MTHIEKYILGTIGGIAVIMFISIIGLSHNNPTPQPYSPPSQIEKVVPVEVNHSWDDATSSAS